ncbi:putative tRNA pseudouridine synthase C25B8.05 [Golovinomyces cichoracearum]|uniref:Putative tRNA pseudouridine synthase C25B8.05 n=1 Tax=Golovinomyces cichoracearum TaxID=62708 RepID=A0A420HNT4_9PEZI|nr:putative tRNA pseudouridine synthase C25B8.05 [Golovinomyces cichoracearum]
MELYGQDLNQWYQQTSQMTSKTALTSDSMSDQNLESSREDYSSWSRERLISRLTQLEQLQESSSRNTSKNLNPKTNLRRENFSSRAFDPTKYSTRLVAFKLAYLGKRYNGFEFHANCYTPLPTIEEELWKAFWKAKLIFPSNGQAVGDWEGCEYSKCGRTDRGVSAFGQVIGLRVRSNRPLGRKRVHLNEDLNKIRQSDDRENEEENSPEDQSQNNLSPKFNNDLPILNAVQSGVGRPKPQVEKIESQIERRESDIKDDSNFDPIADEIPYAAILNRLLPPDIRILAWCPDPPPNFSARFSCRERQYRYFFTQPCFLPIPNSIDPNHSTSSIKKCGFLDIDAMKTAAKLYEGQHDFRNLCKVDASKQLENFVRRINYANIEEVSDSIPSLKFLNAPEFQSSDCAKDSGYPKVYSFTLHGSAFLWHQVRHMVAILFLVGQGLEKPSIVTELLDISQNPGRPMYQMAAETPLVLWDCLFKHEGDIERNEMLQWIYVGDTPGTADTKYGVPAGGLMDNLWQNWRERKIDEILAASLLGLVAGQGQSAKNLEARSNGKGKSQKVFDGRNSPLLQGTYTPVMMKPVMDAVDVINHRYALRKGFESVTDMKKQSLGELNNPRRDHIIKSDFPE